MATERTKYLSYIEDTPKHHHLIAKLASKSGRNAFKAALKEGIAVTYLKGSKIVKEHPDGRIEIIGEIENHRMKVKVGDKTKL